MAGGEGEGRGGGAKSIGKKKAPLENAQEKMPPLPLMTLKENFCPPPFHHVSKTCIYVIALLSQQL